MNRSWAKFYEKSFFAKLCTGRFDWDLVRKFPEENPSERVRLDSLLKEVDRLFLETVDAQAIENTTKIPHEFFSRVRKSPFNKLQLPQEEGGPGVSRLGVFRLLERAFDHSVVAGLTVAGTNAFGIGSILQALPKGPARGFTVDKVKEGAVSGFADTEPGGAANRTPSTTATLTEDGKAYLINGEKAYINNGSVADVLVVSATVTEGGESNSHLFLVDTKSKGFAVKQVHELMGLRGLPIAALSFKDVRVPRELRVETEEENWRDNILIGPLIGLGRLYSLGAASLSMSKKCLAWGKEFCSRRKINGRSLSDYDEIQRNLVRTASEVFALEALVEWCLRDTEGMKLMNRWWCIYAAKNITTMTLAGVVDRTVALFGAEGYECFRSKSGAGSVPLEQLYRDARGLRISGGVDFLVDYKAGLQWLDTFYYNDQFPMPESPATRPRGDEFLDFIGEKIRRFHLRLIEIVRAHPDRKTLFEKERLVILLNQLANELLMMSLSLAKAAQSSTEKKDEAQRLAGVYCQEARFRAENLESQLAFEMRR